MDRQDSSTNVPLIERGHVFFPHQELNYRRKMKMMALPLEILHEIMAYWGGHRLGLTCRRLLKRLSADNYVTTRIEQRGQDDDFIKASVLPNGLFHGVTHVVDFSPEEITYFHGNIIRREISDPVSPDVSALIKGYVVSWCLGQFLLGDMTHHFDDDTITRACSYEDFEVCALEYLEGKPHGNVDTLTISDFWFSDMIPPGIGRPARN